MPPPSTRVPIEPRAESTDRRPVARKGSERACRLSVVLPCLDEADTLATVIRKAQAAMQRAGIDGEVVVADNGSSDGSQAIARECGARVVHVSERGYGSALAAGFRAARGEYVLMGDADDSYDMRELPSFYAQLEQGYDLVQGCRLPAGGGTVLPGAMPFAHRWVGNPALTLLARVWLGVPVNDIYCGMRGFRKELVERLDLRATGMEYATEMIIQAARRGARFAEVPITLHRDGRVAHPPHLRTVRDGWRTLRLFMASGPVQLFDKAGLLLLVLGLLGYALAFARGDGAMGTLLLALGSLALVGGHLSLVFAWISGFQTQERGTLLSRELLGGGLEPRLAGAFAVLAAGVLALIAPWVANGGAELPAGPELFAWLLPATTLACLGVQGLLFAVLAHALAARATT